METKFTLLPVVLFFNCCLAWGQEKPEVLWGIEIGANFMGCKSAEIDYIRGDMVSGDSKQVTDDLRSRLLTHYFGAKVEIFPFNEYLGIMSGLRYTKTNASIRKDSYWLSDSEYFFVYASQHGTTTEYFRVQEIHESYNYLTVPLEFRIFPFGRRRISVYFKPGVEFNYLLETRGNVNFLNEEMRPYSEDVLALAEDVKSFHTAMSIAAGFMVGRNLKPAISFELVFPRVYLTSEAMELVKPVVGAGAQFNVQFPF